MNNTVVTSKQITDQLARDLNSQNESAISEEEVLEGEIVSDIPVSSTNTGNNTPGISGDDTPEKELRSRIESGEWDNLDGLTAFAGRTPEGQLMARTEALDFRIRQLELRLPMLLNEHLHDAYIQILKKIHALRKTKGALLYFFYKNDGQRDLESGK
jgi:hypothetical protein